MGKAAVSAIKNLTRAKTRALLTILAISIGVFALVIISAIGDYGKQAINNELTSLGMDGITVSRSENGLPKSVDTAQLDVIRNQDYVKCAAPVNSINGLFSYRGKTSGCVVWGIDESVYDIVSVAVLYGRMVGQNDVDSGAKVCMVDTTVAQTIYHRDNIVGKNLTVAAGGNQETYEVVGVVKTGGGILEGLLGSVVPSFVYIPLDPAAGKSDQVFVRINKGEDIDVCSASIESLLNEDFSNEGIGDSFAAQNMARQRGALDSILSVLTLILALIGGVSVFVAGMGIMTVMTVSVNERKREIGIKKAIGAKALQILMEFMLEAFFISVIGCVVGIALGFIASFAGSYAGVAAEISATTVWMAVTFSSAAGIIFGLIPAWKASRLNPVEALRSVE